MSMTSSRSLSLLAQVAFAGVALSAVTGCATVAPPFNQMNKSQMTVYRLQNYVPPQPPPANSVGAIAIPPQLQQWITAGASLIPPGLLPPGLLPGSQPAAVAPDAQRFPPQLGQQGFPIIAWQQVSDPGIANDIIDTLGHSSNFQQPAQSCMYAELGISIAQQNGAQPADFLVSLSCGQVQAFNMQWPYASTGLTESSEQKFSAILRRAFGGR
jgi:hypothetical protein